MLLSAMRQHQTSIDTKSSQQYPDAAFCSATRCLFLATSGGLTARRMSATARAEAEVGVSTKDEE